MKTLIYYIIVLGVVIGSAYAIYYAIPRNTDSPYLLFARNIASYIVSACDNIQSAVQEPIQWILIAGGILILMHGLRNGSGILTILGINMFFLGLGWQVAKEVYYMALDLTGNPLFSAVLVLLAGLFGSKLVKDALASR